MAGRHTGWRSLVVLLPVFGMILLIGCASRAAVSPATPDPNDPLAPPRGTLQTTKSIDGAGFAGNQRVYLTPATTSEVLTFYQTQLPQRGWTFLPDRSTPKEGQLTFQGSDGKTILGITVEESGKQRQVSVGIIVR